MIRRFFNNETGHKLDEDMDPAEVNGQLVGPGQDTHTTPEDVARYIDARDYFLENFGLKIGDKVKVENYTADGKIVYGKINYIDWISHETEPERRFRLWVSIKGKQDRFPLDGQNIKQKVRVTKLDNK